MAHSTKEILTALVSEVVLGRDTIIELDTEHLDALYSLSSKHDLSHIVAVGLEHRGITPSGELGKAFAAKKLQAVFRREQLDREELLISTLFEREGIDFIPLKGAVIKDMYPEAWLRTSSDIDILVREADLERAITLIEEELGYTNEGRKHHEHSLISKGKVHLELHFSVLEKKGRLDTVLSEIWSYALPKSGDSSEKVLTNEYFIFYTVAHALAHFIGGGCGIRPIIDLTLMLGKLDFDEGKLDALLTESGSKKFFEVMKSIADAWFFGAVPDETAIMTEEFILSGGIFGSTENYAAAEENRKGGRIRYIFSRVFETTPRMKAMYPILNDRPYLLPLYHIKRWLGLLKPEKFASAKKQLGSKERTERAAELFKRLEL